MKQKNRKAVLKYLVFVAVFLALYLFTKADFAGYVLLALLIWLGISVLAVRFTGKKLSVKILGPDCLQKQEAGRFHIQVKNDSLLPVVSCRITLAIENLATGKHSQITERIFCPPKRIKEIAFGSEEICCGCLRMEIRGFWITDPSGSFSSVREVSAVHDCYVMPQITEVSLSPDALEHYDMESYRYASGHQGTDPSETFGLHTYQPGDSIKAIHWKLSGKMDDLVIREGSFPVESSLILLLDRRITEPHQEVTDRGIETFLSLSHVLAERNIHHTAIWFHYGNGSFCSKKISCQADIFQMLPELLTSPAGEDDLSLADRYLASELFKTVSDRVSYLYVTTRMQDVEKEVERLKNYGKVIVYRT